MSQQGQKPIVTIDLFSVIGMTIGFRIDPPKTIGALYGLLKNLLQRRSASVASTSVVEY